jgi:hypothetical protein
MPEPMRMLGVGSRFSILMLAVATLGGQAGCSTGTSSAAGEHPEDGSEAAAAPAERASAAPQQVVQRMVGKTTSAESNAAESKAPVPDAPASAAGEAVAGEARASAAGVSRAGALAPRASSVETITSKHLEAELNRLEAELAN